MVGSLQPDKKLGEAEFSRDMVETMLEHFDFYAKDGVISIEITERGLWLPHPHETRARHFLGLARLPRWMRN